MEAAKVVGEEDDPRRVVERLVANVDELVAEAHRGLYARVLAGLRDQLSEALGRLAERVSAEEVTTRVG